MRHCILIALLATGILSACGQKGPLHLPDADTQAPTQPAP